MLDLDIYLYKPTKEHPAVPNDRPFVTRTIWSLLNIGATEFIRPWNYLKPTGVLSHYIDHYGIYLQYIII